MQRERPEAVTALADKVVGLMAGRRAPLVILVPDADTGGALVEKLRAQGFAASYGPELIFRRDGKGRLDAKDEHAVRVKHKRARR